MRLQGHPVELAGSDTEKTGRTGGHTRDTAENGAVAHLSEVSFEGCGQMSGQKSKLDATSQPVRMDDCCIASPF